MNIEAAPRKRTCKAANRRPAKAGLAKHEM